jgi:histone H3/H4
MNTSEDVNQILSEMIRQECEKAIQQARAEGRKTVMARDFK